MLSEQVQVNRFWHVLCLVNKVCVMLHPPLQLVYQLISAYVSKPFADTMIPLHGIRQIQTVLDSGQIFKICNDQKNASTNHQFY